MVAVDNARAGMAGYIYPRKCGDNKKCRQLRELSRKAKGGSNPGAVRRSAAGRPAVRRPAARRAPHSLRFSARVRRRAEVLGRAEGAVAEPGRQALGGPRRGPPRRLRQLRGRDPARQLRRGRRHRLGPRPVGRAERHRRRVRQGQAAVRAARPQAARQVDARQNEARQERVAADQGARRVRDDARPRRITRTTPCSRAGPSSRSRAAIRAALPSPPSCASSAPRGASSRRATCSRCSRRRASRSRTRSGCSSSSTTATACSPRSVPARSSSTRAPATTSRRRSRRSPRSSRRCRSRSSSSMRRSSCSTRAACRASRCCKSAGD